jgi:hypothetical protein
MRLAAGDPARMPSSRPISMIFSVEVTSTISMRAKCTLPPSGTTLGYHADARYDNPEPDLSRYAVPPVASRWFILADRSIVAR